jgi:hypothetical protein
LVRKFDKEILSIANPLKKSVELEYFVEMNYNINKKAENNNKIFVTLYDI